MCSPLSVSASIVMSNDVLARIPMNRFLLNASTVTALPPPGIFSIGSGRCSWRAASSGMDNVTLWAVSVPRLMICSFAIRLPPRS